MAEYYDSQSNSYVNADRPQGFGSGLIHDSFPFQGEAQPAHEGSQSEAPSKYEGEIPRADPRPGRYLERGRSLGKGTQYSPEQAKANIKAFDSSISSFNKGLGYRGPGT